MAKKILEFAKTHLLSIDRDSSNEGEETHTHKYTSKITTVPTCQATGIRTYTCDCGASYTETIAKTAHSYIDGVCSVCGDTNNSEPNEPDDSGWERGTLALGKEQDSNARIRTDFIDISNEGGVIIEVAEGYSVSIHTYLSQSDDESYQSSEWLSGTVEWYYRGASYMRIVVKNNQETEITPEFGSVAIKNISYIAKNSSIIVDVGAWEMGAIAQHTGNTVSTTRIRTADYINIKDYGTIEVSFDANAYKVAIFYYNHLGDIVSANAPSYNTTGAIIIEASQCPPYMRIVLARVDDTEMNIQEMSNIHIAEEL